MHVPVPLTLLRSAHSVEEEKSDLPMTVYSVRFVTGSGRGAGISDPMSHVNVCLVGKDGRAVLHRISPAYDPAAAQEEVNEMCQIIGDAEGVGADCKSASMTASAAAASSNATTTPSGYTLPPRPGPQPRSRFQSGTVDEVCFLGPELGPLVGVLVGTESASWGLDELQVASSRTNHVDRFVCRSTLGVSRGEGAAYLTPTPPGSVVYGTGDSAVMLSQEQASTLHAMSMAEYESLKARLLATTAMLTVSGSGVAGLTAGLDAAVPFALGGFAGIIYQWLLQQSVDNVVVSANIGSRVGAAGAHGSSSTGSRPSSSGTSNVPPELAATATLDDPDNVFEVPFNQGQQTFSSSRSAGSSSNGSGKSTANAAKVLGKAAGNGIGAAGAGGKPGQTSKLLASPVVRLGFVGAVAIAAVSLLSGQAPVSGPGVLLPMGREQLGQLVVATLGFMTYKVALVSVSLSAAPPAAVRVDTVKQVNNSGKSE